MWLQVLCLLGPCSSNMLDLSFYYFITSFLVSRVEEERWLGIDYIFL
jgi:hypothetical protein